MPASLRSDYHLHHSLARRQNHSDFRGNFRRFTHIENSELKRILHECHPKVIFVSGRMAARIETIKTSIDGLQHCFLSNEQLTGNSQFAHIDTLKPKNKLASVNRNLEEVAVITYTSSSAGTQKGVMTTFQNLIFQAKLFELIADLKEGERFIAIPPINHLLWLAQGFLAVLHAGGTIYCSRSYSAPEIIALIKERKLTGIIAAPAFYESLKNSIEEIISSHNVLHKCYWKIAMLLSKGLPSDWQLRTEVRHYLFSPLRKILGGNLKILLSGGAPINNAVVEFFELIGIPVLTGYGLTEASPVVACNTFAFNRLGSVGKAVAGVEIKIKTVNGEKNDGIGEICTRGPHIMKGYYKRDDLTATVIDKEGWLHTGDLGKIDNDGFLYVIGRLGQ